MNMERNNKNLLTIIRFVAVVVYCFVCVFSYWLGENVFAYEVVKTKTVKEPYEYVVDTIWDYTCYTTTYGECYHEKGCQYLHSSSRKTTVADAQDDGYRACSKCDPPRKLPVVIKETRYRTVTKTETETKEPTFIVWIVCTGVYILVYKGIEKKLNK